MRPVVGPQDVAGMTVAVQAQAARRTRVSPALLDALQKGSFGQGRVLTDMIPNTVFRGAFDTANFALELLRKDGEVTQARIIYSLMIPKTTLVRLLASLEAKQVILIKKYGKAKKIALTDWILEKE